MYPNAVSTRLSIVRGLNRPFAEIRQIGQLDERASRAIFGKDLRQSGAVRNEDQLTHRIIIGRYKKERVMMNRRVIGYLVDLCAGARVVKCFGFRWVNLTFGHLLFPRNLG